MEARFSGVSDDIIVIASFGPTLLTLVKRRKNFLSDSVLKPKSCKTSKVKHSKNYELPILKKGGHDFKNSDYTQQAYD